jgi:septum formation protein
MLRRLQGRWHTVITAVALQQASTQLTCFGMEATAVHFRPLTDAVLQQYARSGEPDDKAGAYAIQGLGAMLVREVRGCFYNVMGFPIGRFVDLLHELHDGEGNHHNEGRAHV